MSERIGHCNSKEKTSALHMSFSPFSKGTQDSRMFSHLLSAGSDKVPFQKWTRLDLPEFTGIYDFCSGRNVNLNAYVQPKLFEKAEK